jgi:hypothetical protein
MKAFLCFSLALTLFAAPLVGCAEEVEARPPRQPGQVVLVEPVETVNSAPLSVEGVQAAAPGPVTPGVSYADLETWPNRHADAANAFRNWVHNNPEAASEIFTWDGKHAGRSHALVQWAIHHPGEDIATFTSKHPDWAWFDRVMTAHRMGADQYLDWCRKYPTAAAELVAHQSGLRWVGDHFYATEWHP